MIFPTYLQQTDLNEINLPIDIKNTNSDIARRNNTFIQLASARVNNLCQNKIEKIGFNLLTSDQQLKVKQATLWIINDWNASGVSLTRINGSVSVGTGGYSQSNPNEPDYIRQDVIDALEQSGLFQLSDRFYEAQENNENYDNCYQNGFNVRKYVDQNFVKVQNITSSSKTIDNKISKSDFQINKLDQNVNLPNLISSDLKNVIKIGSDNKLFAENEQVLPSNLISSDQGNQIISSPKDQKLYVAKDPDIGILEAKIIQYESSSPSIELEWPKTSDFYVQLTDWQTQSTNYDGILQTIQYSDYDNDSFKYRGLIQLQARRFSGSLMSDFQFFAKTLDDLITFTTQPKREFGVIKKVGEDAVALAIKLYQHVEGGKTIFYPILDNSLGVTYKPQIFAIDNSKYSFTTTSSVAKYSYQAAPINLDWPQNKPFIVKLSNWDTLPNGGKRALQQISYSHFNNGGVILLEPVEISATIDNTGITEFDLIANNQLQLSRFIDYIPGATLGSYKRSSDNKVILCMKYDASANGGVSRFFYYSNNSVYYDYEPEVITMDQFPGTFTPASVLNKYTLVTTGGKELISSDSNNKLKSGTDGKLLVQIADPVPPIPSSLISSDSNNLIVTGTDGKLYYSLPKETPKWNDQTSFFATDEKRMQMASLLVLKTTPLLVKVTYTSTNPNISATNAQGIFSAKFANVGDLVIANGFSIRIANVDGSVDEIVSSGVILTGATITRRNNITLTILTQNYTVASITQSTNCAISKIEFYGYGNEWL